MVEFVTYLWNSKPHEHILNVEEDGNNTSTGSAEIAVRYFESRLEFMYSRIEHMQFNKTTSLLSFY